LLLEKEPSEMADQKPEKTPEATPAPNGEQKGVTAGKGRPTPSRRQMEEEADEVHGNFIQRTVAGLREYFSGVRSELQKVTWPTRQDTRRLSIIVIIALIISSIVLGLISFAFTRIFSVGLTTPIILILIMAAGAGLGWLVTRMVRVRSTTY
jgi:preprotein translocase subunit SecE